MSRQIPGSLSLDALGVLAGDPDQARMRHFHVLTREQQAQAIRRLAATGQSEVTIASATGLSVEFVKRILGEHGGGP